MRKKLDDLLKIKNDISQKIYILFSSFLPILISLISAGFLIISIHKYIALLYFIFPLSIYFFFSLLFLFLTFRGLNIGCGGTEPSFWLQKEYINGDSNTLSFLLAQLTFSYDKRLKETFINNNKRRAFRESGILLILFGVFTSFLFFLAQYSSHLNISPLYPLAGLVMVSVIQLVFCYCLARRY